MTTNEHGESVRGFQVIVTAGKNRRFGLGEKQFSLPPSGFPLYTGEKALEIMRAYALKRPGVTVAAFTRGEFSGDEHCTLAEMESLYGKEFYELSN